MFDGWGQDLAGEPREGELVLLAGETTQLECRVENTRQLHNTYIQTIDKSI